MFTFLSICTLWLRGLESNEKSVIPIFENGSYWLHSKNLFLAGLADQDDAVRKLVISQILRLRHDPILKETIAEKERQLRRKKNCSFKKQRIFQKPQINYEAGSYFQMIDWEVDGLYEPPYTKAMSDEELQKISIAPLEINISSNSVLMERMIRTVDQVAEKLTSPKMRDGMV